MVVGALTILLKSSFISTLKFRGAFPYPVVIKILTIFDKGGIFDYEI